MSHYYVAYLDKDADSDYGVRFPDVPGCYSAGRTLDEAAAMAAEALAFHLESLAKGGDPIPEPRSLETIGHDPERGDALAFLVPVRGTKTKRINVTMPEDLIGAIDRAAGNRSAFLAEAAREKLSADE